MLLYIYKKIFTHSSLFVTYGILDGSFDMFMFCGLDSGTILDLK